MGQCFSMPLVETSKCYGQVGHTAVSNIKVTPNICKMKGGSKRSAKESESISKKRAKA